ncbi:MAG: hypothetical protein ACLRFI_02335 [Alphaproteobacteria bacterium]
MKKTLLFTLFTALLACGCSNGDKPYDVDDFENGGPDAPYYNEPTADMMESGNEYSNIDSYKPKTAADRESMNARWNTSRMETHWQEYKGTMVRVQVLLGNSDVREMRLRLMQNAAGTDTDRDARGILSAVADYEMKHICGRNTESIVIVYDEPSFEVMRPTPYFDYRIEAEGETMREYGFKCVYKN